MSFTAAAMVRVAMNVPPVVKPPTPTSPARPPGIAKPSASKYLYTSVHLAPGYTVAVFVFLFKETLFIPLKSTVTPFMMLDDPVRIPCPPLLMANLHDALAKSSTTTATSPVFAGETAQLGVRRSLTEKYEFTNCWYKFLWLLDE